MKFGTDEQKVKMKKMSETNFRLKIQIFALMIFLFGNSAFHLQAKYLPKLATGTWMAGYCQTETEAGSDPNSIKV